VRSNEVEAKPFRMSGLERVLYSPKERNIPEFSGDDALIRFWGEQVDEPWVGDDAIVIQISQHLRQRDPYTNWEFWDTATRGLPRLAIGPGSEVIGGPGAVSFEEMKSYLMNSRAFLWTGSQPASYTLGLIEAMHAGIPTVSIGCEWMQVDYGHTARDQFEGHEIAILSGDDPNAVRWTLKDLLAEDEFAETISRQTRARARELFDRETVGQQWKAYLG
jgi:glycosyltransferase involved in cell wall biosynthesis